jgi:Lrp/AsnC family leucine-responsive transcriptional regulator
LEQRKVIQRYTVTVDPAALGKTVTAFIRLTVAYDEKHDSGIEAVSQDPDVLELYSVAGEDCFIIKTRVGSAQELQALVNRIRTRVTVLRSVTMIALSALKENAPISVTSCGGSAKPKTTPRARR